MAIHSIDKVTIDGKNRAFGGFIYAVDYEVGVLDQPSKVVITLVNDNGIYVEPELSVIKPYRLKIGNILDEKFYAIERRIQKSSGGRTLEVTFCDGSIILDRLWVGLHKRMGGPETSVPGLIIVGKELHPCDANEDGVFDQKDADLLTWEGLDPCELKCPSDSDTREPVLEKCFEKELTNLFPIKYSIEDLFNALQGTVPDGSPARPISYPVENDLAEGSSNAEVTLPALKSNKNTPAANRVKIKQRPAVTNTFFKADYTGTLREVLKNWCNDFGWSFTWEDDSLVFLDTKERPNLVFPDFKDRLRSVSDTKTLEGTVSRGFHSTYLQEGITSKKDCKQSSSVMLHCLTLQDLFGNFYRPQAKAILFAQKRTPNPIGPTPKLEIADPIDPDGDNQVEYFDTVKGYESGVPIEKLEAACVCAGFSNILRDLYIQWNYYGITNDTEAAKLKGKWLDRLGQVKILAVFGPNGKPNNVKKYEALLGDFHVDKTKAPENEFNRLFSDADAQMIRRLGGFITVVRRRRKNTSIKQLLQLQYKIEERLAKSFMGQHWYRAYTNPSYGHSPTIFPSGQYFGEMSMDINHLEFAKFNHTEKSRVASIVGTFLQKQNNDYTQRSSKLGAVHSARGGTPSVPKVVRSMVYFGRGQGGSSPLWSPIPEAQNDLKTIFDTYGKLHLRTIDMSPREVKKGEVVLIEFSSDWKKNLLAEYIDDDTKETSNAVKAEKDLDIDCIDVIVMFPQPTKEVIDTLGNRKQVTNGLNLTHSFADHINTTHPEHVESDEPYGISTAGMLSNKCVVYDLAGKKIYTPIGASVHFDTDRSKGFSFSYRAPSKKDFDAPSYKVFITSSISNRGLIPKTEIAYVQYADMNAARRVEYKTHSLDRNSIRFLNKLTVDCRLDPDQIRALHETLSKNLNFNVTKPFRSIQYEIFGVTSPTALSPSSGLESLKIRVDGQGGITTSISIGDKLFTPVPENMILKALENGISPRLAGLTPNPL